nr:MAG TPA: polyVal ADP-ribosyltransferase [Caudoviricetes sp.]
MSLISKKKFMNGVEKNQSKAAGSSGGLMNRADFVSGVQNGNEEMRRRQAAFEAYRAAVQLYSRDRESGQKKTENAGAEIGGKVSQQEYSRSSAMQTQYGTYQNYLRGVEAAQGRQLGTTALQKQSAALAFRPSVESQKDDVNKAIARARAMKTVERDQVRGMRQTSKLLAGEIYNREVEQADTHFSGTGLSENGKSVTQLQNEIDALQKRKAQVDSQSVLTRAQEAIGSLSEEDQNLLRQYRGKELNGYQVRAYAKYDAKTALNEKGYDDEKLKQLAEWQKVLDDYENAQKLDAAAQEIGQRSPVGGTLFSAALAPGKALGNVESLRGVLPGWAGGYQNEDMPTNVYSPAYNATRLSSGIRGSVMQGMNPTGQFLYQAGTSALDSAVNMAVSTGLVGAFGGVAGAGAKDAVAETMNWVMGSQVAADSVYEGIQNGKSNEEALIDGIVEGAIEGFTEKYSVGNIIENMLSGKAVWRKALRSFASEGAEEIASNWLNRAYDVVAKHDRGEVMSAYAAYIADGKTPAQALAAMVGDFVKEDGLSFLAGGLSGLAMSGTYAGVNRVITEANVTQTARAVLEAGEVQDVIDYGMAQEEGTRAHQLAEELQQTVDAGGEVTQKAVEDTLREVAKEQQSAVDEGQEPRVPETLTRIEQLQEQARQEQAQAEADEKTFQIYKSAAETAQENQRFAQQYQQEQEQNRAQQSVQAVQQAQQAAQRQYDQDSLFAPIPGTENMGELDPVQYAQRQTADAEQELDEAAAQQEEQYLQEQARRAGYDETTAAYFLNGNTTGMPAEQYAQSFGQVYAQGRLGASEQRAMRYAEGMNQDVAAAAYRAGLAAGQKGVNNGSIEVTDEGQVGQAGQRAEGQAGGVRQSTAQQQRADTGRKRAQGARDLAKAWDEVTLSELGFGENNAQKVRVMPKGQEGRSEDIQAAAKFFRSMGVQNARFFTGQLAQEIDGQTFYADAAVTEDGSVLIRADSEEHSAFELAKHEGYHLLVKRWPEMAAKIQKRLLGEGKITKEMIESYVDAYAGIYGDDTNAYVEEIIADTYAGMNRTDYGTNKLRADVKMEVGQWQKKSGSARAPPAKMSASSRNRRAETQEEITRKYQQDVHDILTGEKNTRDALLIGYTPEIYRKLGMPDLPFVIGSGHVYSMTKTAEEAAADGKRHRGTNYHGLGESVVADIMDFVKAPVMVISAKDVDARTTPMRSTHSVVALIDVGTGKESMVIPVAITAERTVNGVRMDVNAISSAYEKNATGLVNEAIAQFNAGENSVFYVKKEAANLLGAGVQFPEQLKAAASSDGIVREFDSKINMSVENVTQSQQFKRWFGDWQNHPERASKVVNADGTPKVVYHGTNAEFNTFQQENGAYFFSESRDYAESMADERRGNRIIEAYLKMKNPYTVKLSPEQFTDNIAEAPFIRYAKEHGHDGVIFEYDGSKEDLAYDKFYVVFDSTQIKSATDNIGTFDKTNPDIRFSASARQASERDKQNLETVSAMLDDGSGRGVFKDAVFLRNPRLMQKLVDEREKTQTAAFRDWFAGSKATNTEGEPLLVFHGAGAKFTKFDVGGKPIWLTANIKYAEEYSTATRSVERILPEASIYAGNVDRIIPAYIRVENPADVGNTDGGYSGNYVDLAKRLQIRPSELQAVWEQAGKPELMWQVVNTPGMVEMLKRHGYDGIQAVENGVKAWAVFDSAQVKSAVANNGSFSLTNPDIRYSSQDGRYRDLMGEKAAQYTRRAENFLLAKIAGSFGVSPEAKRETLQPFTEQIVRRFLQTGELDNKLVDDLVKTAAEISVEENRSYYEEYKGVLKFIENQKISIPAQDKEDIRYWNQFRQQAAKSMQIRDDGMPVRDVYWTLHKKAPQLFPASNKTAGAQIMQIYKVAEGIRKTREWIEGYKGVDAAEVSKVKQDVFEARATNARLDWAKNDARNAVKEFAADLRVTQRYLDRQKKAKDLLGLAIPQSAGEALELSKEVKKLRGRVQYVMNKNLLTAEDQKIVGALLRGDISEEAVRKMKNSKGILDVYEAKAAYDARMLTLRAWRVQNKQRMLDEVDADLDAAKFDQWADKGAGWGYNTETPERNFADVMRKIPGGDVLAKEFNNKYIYKIKQNESARKNFILEIQERVKKLDISEKVMRGNADSEAYAVQLLGEAQENAEMLKGQDAETKKDGKTYEEWLAVIQKLKADNPNMDFAKIDKAITEFHKIYDELLDMINQVRVQFGYDPVSYRRGYFPHFTENEESILARFGRELGFTGTVSPLPTTINGLTSRFRPGIRYFKNANERLGYATAYNAIKGLDLYLDTASDVIFHTEDVQRMRALETQIRYRASDEGIRRQMDAIKANNALDPDQKQQLIDELSKNGRTRMSHMAAWLTQYTNVLAGKRTDLDRKLEEIIPQKIYNFMRKAQQRVGANMVAANIGSAVTNFIPLTQAWAQTSTVNMMKGMWYTLANYVQADGLDQQSVFINNRSGYHGLSQSSMDKASEIAGWVMEKIDGFTTGSIVRARVIENMQRGMSQQSALEEADQFASGIMADRSKGATPLMYTVRSPIVKMFTQFQLEVNNELSWIFKDMLPQERKKGVLALVKALLKFAIGAWLYNEAAEAILGRRPALDPLDMLNDTVGDVSGYKVPNTWQAMAEYGVNPKNWDYTTEKKTPEEAWKGFVSRVVDELPNTQLLAMTGLDEAIGLDLQGNRIAVISAFPDMEKVNKALLSSKEDMATKKKAQVLVDELSKPLSYAALPMGGGQARKSLQGIMSVVNGGKYSLNNEGEQQLQYPTYTDRPGDVPLKLAQGVLFGRTATQEAQDWIENGFKSLSVKETKAYQAITEGGEDQRKTYTFVQAIKNVEKEYDKKMLLKSYSISDTAKTTYFYQVFANEDQQKEMDKLDEQGKIDFMKKYLAEAEDNHNRDELRDAAVAGTVTQEKAIQRMVANDWAKNEDDAYWKYREWVRKADDKDYKMYDDFLNAIEAGGDVKEAAREYLEHGKEAKDLSRQITTAYKEQYLAATPEERRKLKQKLLEIYAALGFNRKEKSKGIDEWVKDAAKEKKDK